MFLEHLLIYSFMKTDLKEVYRHSLSDYYFYVTLFSKYLNIAKLILSVDTNRVSIISTLRHSLTH